MEKISYYQKKEINITTEGCDLALELGKLLQKIKEKLSIMFALMILFVKIKVKYQMVEKNSYSRRKY